MKVEPASQNESGNVRQISTGGLAGRTSGTDAARPPLVLLHGLTFDHTMWDESLNHLLEIDPRRRVLALDLPGHGASDPAPAYDLGSVAALVHNAVAEAGVTEPVMVGHSLAAVLVTFYASMFPVAGVVNVDQSLQTEGFSQMVASMADRLRGPDFTMMWPLFRASMHAELLPQEAQDLLTASSTPTQELVTGYWKDVLDMPADELSAHMAEVCEVLRQRSVPYLSVMGAEPEASYVDWLAGVLPQAKMEILPGSGHFPHLKHPARFARILADTAPLVGSPS